MGINQVASDLYKALTESDERKPKAGDVKATVIREEGNTVWVKFPGGEDETPVQKTNNATIGDEVMVRTADGRAWILGNNTSPATDDTTANKAAHQAIEAFDVATFANASAEVAKTAADSALRSAETAQAAADRSKEILDSMEQAAEDADTTLTAIYQDAKRANDNADAAQASANETKNYAYMAMSQLSIVEDVVGVLELVSENAEYKLTEDEEVLVDKWYFTRSGTDPNYVYTIVNNPTGNPSTQDWYEITNISDAIRNYISGHLVLMSPTRGFIIYNKDGDEIAQYGEEAIIGKPDGFNIKIGGTNNEIGFYLGSTNRIAYLNGNELYVQNSLSFGNAPHNTFTFYQRANGHFTLKLVD